MDWKGNAVMAESDGNAGAKRGRSRLLAGLWVTALAGLAAVGCQYFQPSTAAPEVVRLEEAAAENLPLQPARVVPEGLAASLQFPTLTPAPTEYPIGWSPEWATRQASGRYGNALDGPLGFPVDAGLGGFDPDGPALAGQSSGFGGDPGPFRQGTSDYLAQLAVGGDPKQACIAEFRRRLAGYVPADFRGEELDGFVVGRLAAQFLEERADCAELGWAAEPREEAVCKELYLPSSLPEKRQLNVPDSLWDRTERRPRTGATQKEGRHVVVHFDRLPYQDAAGCWLYHGSYGVWAWEAFANSSGLDSVGGGVDWAEFPECWTAVAEEAATAIADPYRVVDVASLEIMVERVRRQGPERCDSARWRATPREQPAQGCPVLEPVGKQEDDSVVLHWSAEPPEYYACWVWQHGSWQRFARD